MTTVMHLSVVKWTGHRLVASRLPLAFRGEICAESTGAVV